MNTLLSKTNALTDEFPLGVRIKTLREREGLGKAAFSEKADVQRTHLHSIENGKQPLTLNVAMSLSNTYGVTLDWLVKGEGSIDDAPPRDLRFEDKDALVAAILLTGRDVQNIGRVPPVDAVCAIFEQHLDECHARGAEYDAKDFIENALNVHRSSS